MPAPAQHIATAHDGPLFRLYRWTLGADEVGAPVIVVGFPRLTVYVWGSFAGGAVRIEIAPDPEGSVWLTASDRHGNPLSRITSARVEQLAEHAFLLRPVAGASVERVTAWALLSALRSG